MALCEMKNNYNPIYVIKHGILHFILMPWQFSYVKDMASGYEQFQ